MSARSASPTPSTSSSAGGEEAQDGSAASRLAQLEALLAASLGYDARPAADELEGEQPARRKRRQADADEAEGQVVEAAKVEAAAPTEVAFRLFSTQKAPQTVVIEEEEELLEVKDPRIRDVADEPKELVKQRKRDIKSVAVCGADLVAQSTKQPLSRFAQRVSPRTISASPRIARSLPSLAYLNAILQPATKPTTSPTPTSLRSKRRALRPQTKHRPGPAAEDVKLRVVPVRSKKHPGARAAEGEEAEKTQSGARKRLSGERRRLERTRRAKQMVLEASRAVEAPSAAK